MVWKAKEKELTLEQAIEATKTELRPFWFGMSPKIAGVKTESKLSVFPLDPEFVKTPWIFLFFDPMDLLGETTLLYAHEWRRRYSSLQCNVIGIIEPKYSFLKDPEAIQGLIEQRKMEIPIVLDHERLLIEAFQVKHFPTGLLLHQGKTQFSFSEKGWFTEFEKELQTYLRKSDPGLPLLEVEPLGSDLTLESTQIDFREGANSEALSQIEFQGNWVQEAGRRVTSDPNASLTFMSYGSRFTIIAESAVEPKVSSRITIEVDSQPAFEDIAGEDLIFTDSGSTEVEIKKPRLYHLLPGLPQEPKKITLCFTQAQRTPVALYGLRMGRT